jgi:hypothetical protein
LEVPTVLYILIGYMWLFIHRPFEVWPVLGDWHVERAYMLLALLAWVVSGKKRWLPNSLHLAYAAFALAVLVCWMASPWSDTEKAHEVVENYFKLVVFYLLLVTTIRTEDDLKKVVLAFIAITGIYMLHSYREFLDGRHKYRMGIPRMVGVDMALGDPNSFSASIVYALPLVLPCWSILREARPRWSWLLLAYVALSVLCILLTGSRGGFISMVLCIMIYAIRSQHRGRVLLALVCLAPLVWFIIPTELQNRFYSVIDPSVAPDAETAKGSADSRSEGFWVGLDLWRASPATGCGPGAWVPATRRTIEAHNLYGQVMGEMGLLGVLTFTAILVQLCRNIRAIKSPYRDRSWSKDWLYYLADAVGVAIILLLFLGWGAHSLFRFTWLWYGAFLVVARHLVSERLQAEAAGLAGDLLSRPTPLPTD